MPASLILAATALAADQPAHCSRCTGPYDSVVVLRAPSRRTQAGLGDRSFVLRGVANLASSLCAQLIAPSPIEILDTKKHNHNHSLDVNTSWSRYFSMTSWDGVDYLTERWNVSSAQARLTNSSWRRGVLELHANSVEDVVAQYGKVARATAAGEPFVWNIGGATSYWEFRLPLEGEVRRLRDKERDHGHFHVTTAAPHLSGDCDHGQVCVQGGATTTCGDYVSIAASLEVRHAASSALRRLAPEASGAGAVATLHVRRGDTIETCNTSVSAVLEYLRCAKLDSSTRAVASPTFLKTRQLLLFTDETDATYISSLAAAIEAEFASQQLKVSHADPAVSESGAHATDNFFTFAVVAHLIQTSGMQFGVHRCHGNQRMCQAHLGPVEADYLVLPQDALEQLAELDEAGAAASSRSEQQQLRSVAPTSLQP